METKVVNLYHDSYDIYIGRKSKWGNPFTHLDVENTLAEYKVESREEAIESYENWIRNNSELMESLSELRGHTLGCFCKPKSCHGDVLVKLIKERFGE